LDRASGTAETLARSMSRTASLKTTTQTSLTRTTRSPSRLRRARLLVDPAV